MVIKKILFFFLVYYIFVVPVSSQSVKTIVYFSNKDNSSSSISNPTSFLSARAIERRQRQNIPIDFRDLPVNSDYLDSLSSTGAQVLFPSKWLNAALVIADPSQLSLINAYSFVKSSQTAWKTSVNSLTEINLAQQISLTQGDYGSSFNQISLTGTDQMHQDGLAGNGKLIAVIDAGFKNADTLRIFDSLFIHNRIIATYDFVDSEVDVYNDHEHGTQVLSVMGGYLPGSLIGSAWQASYLLLRSEEDAYESLSEEFNFVRAAEYADSAGVDLINCSLGYAIGFDNPAHNHVYSDMDGNSNVITKAADIAASRGILVVVSAGNEGTSPWQKITAPADGDSVLAIGATNASGYYQLFSSKGPSYDGRIKPDLATQGSGVYTASFAGGLTTANGTSLASPLITGLAAGLWQAFPDLTNMELLYYLRMSGSQYFKPDNYLGYGIPHYHKTKELIAENALHEIGVFPNPGDGSFYVINFPISENGKEINLQLFDRTGRIIFTQKTIAGPRLELNSVLTNQPSGMYFVQVIGSQKKYSLKLIKE